MSVEDSLEEWGKMGRIGLVNRRIVEMGNVHQIIAVLAFHLRTADSNRGRTPRMVAATGFGVKGRINFQALHVIELTGCQLSHFLVIKENMRRNHLLVNRIREEAWILQFIVPRFSYVHIADDVEHIFS